MPEIKFLWVIMTYRRSDQIRNQSIKGLLNTLDNLGKIADYKEIDSIVQSQWEQAIMLQVFISVNQKVVKDEGNYIKSGQSNSEYKHWLQNSLIT
jgi:hypothetical protein